jgi:4'-phosphopantetheinyl transferase
MSEISVEVRPWLETAGLLQLGDQTVHVWSASLVVGPSSIQALQRTLTADETARADRFVFEKDRDHFIVARGLLRTILSRYVDMDPSDLRFHYGAHGKPALANVFRRAVRFNLSHSNGLAIYAITRNREIGVDLECMRADFPGFEIAERFFSAQEVATLRSLPQAKRQEAFFSYWTLKEAYLKATGKGLALPLDQFDVSACLHGSHSLRKASGGEKIPGWTLQGLVPAAGYMSALAVQAK